MAEPDIELVRQAQAGDRQALAHLVESYQRYVYSVAMSMMSNPADAADMTQESFIRVLRSLSTFRGETKFSSWLFRLTTNVCLDELRRRGRPVTPLDEEAEEDEAGVQLSDADPWAQPEERLQIKESAADVRRALSELPEPQRLALTLYYFDDMRYEDIASAMGVPMNTVKSHLRRGKERLAAAMQQIARGQETACGAMK